VEAGKPNNSDLMEVITKNQSSEEFMPPSPRSPLTSEQIAMIEIWILEGAKNTDCATTNCDSVNVTYSSTIAGIMTSYCTGCHGSVSPSAGLTLSTHAQVAAAVNNKNLMDHVNHANGFSAMPPSGIKLSVCNLAQLKKWINEGMPNN
jgi:cytochrome c5